MLALSRPTEALGSFHMNNLYKCCDCDSLPYIIMSNAYSSSSCVLTSRANHENQHCTRNRH